MHPSSIHNSEADAALLDILTGPDRPTPKTVLPRRDAALDPLLIAAASASGPHVTRNHYQHDFFPGVMLPQSEGSWDWTKFTGEDASTKSERKRLMYVSRQAPRRQRLGLDITHGGKENAGPLIPTENLPTSYQKKRRSSLAQVTEERLRHQVSTQPESTRSVHKLFSPLEVKCMARTRIPTPHGPVFLHIYHNNRDSKEHMAIVVDPAQFSGPPAPDEPPHIRSRTLDAVWTENETEMDRITRGAYVGRLSPTSRVTSNPPENFESRDSSRPVREVTGLTDAIPSPLIRIHSECFTGETVGSMRCDCGEQLDEAIRLISQPIAIPSQSFSTPSKTLPGRGAVIYLRQEGRGIGLLSKIRAYNLQDLGHDTVTANLMLGHQADERGYEVACAILRDLGLGNPDGAGENVRVLTNNPDKVEALEKEGIRVVQRVPMIPRSWKTRNPQLVDHAVLAPVDDARVAGATLIGGGAVHGEDLDKYLRTKVLKMGHILPLWLENPEQQ
ncbi:GTP cyclohydrolase II-domain-containing protein [Lentinula edodes]|uniref:GTP cyclohydrolase II-domain-containing protein n=1 Tax=Lentinula edodes TaxID=5353 RepID=UPI001E8EA566|nr:GTP cyclohydrolase II-domain-containing protein [Lentinula edodes]KAH7877047.1 GTP cyclohydrolase II-domain-containing protein [Lentinula edodes]